jgi:hypothetical protein
MKRLHWILFLLLILVEPPLPTVAQVLPGTPLPAKVGSPAPAGRFSEEELALFAATTDPFQISGIPVDPGSGRLQKLEPFIEHPVPAYREMARATRDLIALNEIARGEPARAEAEMTELSRQWEGFITDSIFENLGVGPQVDPVARTESIGLVAQNQAIRQRRMEVFGADLRRVVRAKATEVGARKEGALPVMSGAMDLSLKQSGGFLYLQVGNRTSRAWTHCLITARRVQDPNRIPDQGDDEIIATGMIGLLGFSGESIATNNEQAGLLQKVQMAEHGAFVYVPEVAPGATVRFIVAPSDHLEFTSAIEASMWCDEGQELRRPADLEAFTRLSRTKAKPDQPDRPVVSTCTEVTAPPARPPLGSSSRLHGAKGLHSAKGLNGASLQGARGLQGAK